MDNIKIYVKLKMLTLNFKRYEDKLFYIVTFVYLRIVYIESCMYKSVLGKIHKLQKKTKKKQSIIRSTFICLSS